MARMMDHSTTGRKMVPAIKAAEIFGCSPSYLAHLGRSGELKRHVESPRAVFYELEEVKRLAKEKAELRKRRGGRPRQAD